MKNSYILILLLISFKSVGQVYKLGKVTEAELNQKRHHKDTSAVAAVLFQIGQTNFEYNSESGFSLVTKIATKIKIYKKEGYDFANYAQTYRNGTGNSEKISFSKAATYNLVNNKIVKSKVNSEGIFTEQVSSKRSTRKITFPDIKEGSIIEFEMEYRSPYLSVFEDWDFQIEIPVNYSEYCTIIPEYYTYKTYLKGFYSPVTTSDSKISKREQTFTYNGFLNNVVSKTEIIEYTENITNYVLKDIPALKEEAYTNNIDNYKSSLAHDIASVKFPGSKSEDYSTDWESTTKTIYNDTKFSDALKAKNYFENDLKPLLKDVVTRDEKIKVVFDFVKSRMNWNKKIEVLCTEDIKTVYKNKVGNSAEINLMLIAMLRFAEIDTYPVVLSTRAKGISLFPSLSAFNNVIAVVETPTESILLDATSKNATLNILPIHNLNWTGRIIRSDGSSSSINLVPSKPSINVIKLQAKLDENGIISGSMIDQNFDYNAFVSREENNHLSKEMYLEKLEKQNIGIQIEDLSIDNKFDVNESIIEKTVFKHNNSVDVINNKMYLNSLLFFSVLKNPFTLDKRDYPVDFIFPKENRFMISINIPETYEVEKLPLPCNYILDNNSANFKYNIVQNGNQIQISAKFSLNQAFVIPENYIDLKQFFDHFVSKNAEKIILRKKSRPNEP